MRKRGTKSVGQILSDVDAMRWRRDLESYATCSRWAAAGSLWAAEVCERILARYPKNLHKHFTHN